jgi:GT2 family glycosyltransferase
MSALIAMCCYDTEENGRTKYTELVLDSIDNNVNLRKHRLIIIDNNSCQATHKAYEHFTSRLWDENVEIIYNDTNLGTAEAINLAWKQAKETECLIKMDNDIVVHQRGWVDEMEECINRDPNIGILGLKRNDLEENPTHHVLNWRSELVMVPHEAGQTWLIIEKVKHVMGSCMMVNPLLFNKIGYLYQVGQYALDDSDFSQRSILAGFINAFLPSIHISHIDEGGTEYTEHKKKYAGERLNEFAERCQQYANGTRSLFYSPFETT